MEYESERYSTVVEESENDCGGDSGMAQYTGTAGESGDVMGVEELQNYGIGMADIQKLKISGICTVKVHTFSIIWLMMLTIACL
jgi:hypothetical protein